ncbi:MAG: cbb3-type cytochrome oxidase assembly protein CcoS [Planctomycetota bacterium]
MSVLYIALPLALLLGFSATVACVACLRGGQFDDLETPSIRILVEEMTANRPSEGENHGS